MAVAEFDAVVSGDIYVFAPKDKRLLPELLPFICLSERFFKFAVETSAGSLSPRTNWSHLAQFEFALPPLAQQRRLAALLWAVDELLEANLKVLEQMLLSKKAFCQHTFSRFTRSEKLGSYVSFITSGSRGWAQYYSNSGELFIRVTNLTRENPEFDFSDTQYVQPPQSAEMLRTRIKSRDLLISVTADLGRIAVVPVEFPEAYMNQHVALVRLNTSLVDPYFVAYYLLSPDGQRQFHVMNDQGTKAGMNLTSVQNLQIPTIELHEQKRYAEQLGTFDKTIGMIRTSISQLKTLGINLVSVVLS